MSSARAGATAATAAPSSPRQRSGGPLREIVLNQEISFLCSCEHQVAIGNNIWDLAPSVAFTYTSKPLSAESTEPSVRDTRDRCTAEHGPLPRRRIFLTLLRCRPLVNTSRACCTAAVRLRAGPTSAHWRGGVIKLRATAQRGLYARIPTPQIPTQATGTRTVFFRCVVLSMC